jgi:carbon storage regulator
MLVIRRKAGESILIGAEIEVEVVELSPSRVKLGIRAPREILILRKEVRLAGEQNLAASRGVSSAQLRSLVAHLRRTRPSRGGSGNSVGTAPVSP